MPRRPERARAGAPAGLLIAAGQQGAGVAVTAALLARQAVRAGHRPLVVAPGGRGAWLAALLGMAAPPPGAAVEGPDGISVCETMPAVPAADVVLMAPAARASALADSADLLAGRTSHPQVALLVPRGNHAAAAAFAALKVITARQPALPASVIASGDADPTPVRQAAERWLSRVVATAPALPYDPTLPLALAAGIPLAEGIGDPMLADAAAALFSTLFHATPAGAIA